MSGCNVSRGVSLLHRLLWVAPLCILIFVVVADAEDPTALRVWKATATLEAPEAHQAAAADEKYFYAISSTAVAKYDRASGERIAVSTGAAQHLNSGFLWEGKLYCAHSNYPQKPEQSEIRVLNLDAMRLTTFKDFGNFAGSLGRDGYRCNSAGFIRKVDLARWI